MSTQRRYYNVDKVLDLLEDLGDFNCAEIFLDPPSVDELTDEDSGDEDTGGNIQNLNGRQLTARATATIIRGDGREHVGDDEEGNVSGAMEEELDDFDEDPDYEPAPSTSTRASRPRKRQACTPYAQPRKRPKASKQSRQKRTWLKTDLTGRQKDRFAWETPFTDTANLPQDPTELFELFFDEDIIELIVNQSINYAASKGKNTFTVTYDEIRPYLGILLLSGYTSIPRTRFYWSYDKDVHIVMGSLSNSAKNAMSLYT